VQKLQKQQHQHQQNTTQQDPAHQNPAHQDPAQQDPAQQDPAQQDPAQQNYNEYSKALLERQRNFLKSPTIPFTTKNNPHHNMHTQQITNNHQQWISPDFGSGMVRDVKITEGKSTTGNY